MHRKSGFTLIELMIVVISLASLAGMVLPRVLDRVDYAKVRIAQGEIASIVTALRLFRLDMGEYPSDDQGLRSLMQAPSGTAVTRGRSWNGPYLEKEPVDPWGRDYQYRRLPSNAGVEVWSNGPDESRSDGRISNLTN